jgi:hypothetical protein
MSVTTLLREMNPSQQLTTPVALNWGLLLLRFVPLAKAFKEYPDCKFRGFLGIPFNNIKTSHL